MLLDRLPNDLFSGLELNPRLTVFSVGLEALDVVLTMASLMSQAEI